MANLSAIVTVKTVNPKRIECASVNCDREGRLENAVQGRLQLNSEGRAIWVTAYVCDVCMAFMRDGTGFFGSKGSDLKGYGAAHQIDDDLAIACGCPCLRCETRRQAAKKDK